jgi:hypothetical protein
VARARANAQSSNQQIDGTALSQFCNGLRSRVLKVAADRRAGLPVGCCLAIRRLAMLHTALDQKGAGRLVASGVPFQEFTLHHAFKCTGRWSRRACFWRALNRVSHLRLLGRPS